MLLLLANVRAQDLEEQIDISIPHVNFASALCNLGGEILMIFSLTSVQWCAADN